MKILDKNGNLVEAQGYKRSGGEEPVIDGGKLVHSLVNVEVRHCKEDGSDGGEGDRTLEFISSDETVDSYGDIISHDGWNLAEFESNPRMLWMHRRGDPPIGTGVKSWIDKTKKALMQRFTFFPRDMLPFSDTVFKLFKGFEQNGKTIRGLSAVSVGFRADEIDPVPDEGRRKNLGLGQFGILFLKQTLKETSAVTVPANPSALIQNAYNGMLQRSILLDDDLDALEHWANLPDWLKAARQEQRGKTFTLSNGITSATLPYIEPRTILTDPGSSVIATKDDIRQIMREEIARMQEKGASRREAESGGGAEQTAEAGDARTPDPTDLLDDLIEEPAGRVDDLLAIMEDDE